MEKVITKINSHGTLNLLSDKPKDQKSENFPIVGIGASAGGLEALEQFFSNMSITSGMSFVVIQHLDPTHKGLLRELIQRTTKMPVLTVTDALKVKPDSVYIIPPNSSMSILNGKLHLFEPKEARGLRLPIDLFFKALADDRHEDSVGIILSGMGSDGSTGIKAIKEKDGLVLVQDPGSAKFDGMPKSAIDSVNVDVIASAIDLPERLLSIVNRNLRTKQNNKVVKDLHSLEKVIIILRLHTGHDFSQYKKATMYRRIERRMSIHQIDKMPSYVRYLQENETEADILFRELLIGVTGFFRNPEVWDTMIQNAIPALCQSLPDDYVLRAWVPGCSTGEEAYSLAIAFREAVERSKINKNLNLHIFATDIDSNAIERARKGLYQSNITADLSPARLARYFKKEDDQYHVNIEIRDMVVFAPHSVIRDPPFTKIDMISCRNLLIYLESDLQEKLLYLFHNSLNKKGLLMLGNSENNGSNSDLFVPIDARLRIYQRSDLAKIVRMADFPTSFSSRKPTLIESQVSIKVPENLGNLTMQLLIEQFSPSSVLVTNRGDILYITGNTKKYLSPAAGKASMNLFAMAAEGLRNELPIAFRKATQSYNKVIIRNIKLDNDGLNQYADITIQQIEKPLALKGRLLVVFTDVPETDIVVTNPKKGKGLEKSLIDGFENEIQRIKEELQSTREEMQITQEEHKSTNEELQSANEELQSTNEELTTSKEEMQSLNEELHTLNVELQSKIKISLRLNNDLINLLNRTEIATLFIDRDLKIRQFSKSITKIFKFQESDIGRAFTDLVTDLDYPGIYSDALEVLQTLIFKEKEIATKDGRWFKVRIMPYRTLDDKIDGLIITFVSITKLKNIEFSLKESQMILRSFIQIVPAVILGLSSDGIVLEFNPEAEKLFGRKKETVIGKNYVDLFIVESSRKAVNEDLKKLLGGNLPDRYVNHVKAVNGDELLIEWMAHKLLDENGLVIGIINIGVNITKK